ncbi:MAG: hypothetical protein KatS3mg096_743 [Candidatus Parcubacteria bacterium]|nr:MAG: hypothetical protein KatS3mg096_743 [Candidatus Parcubacteria bacterium]
MAQVKLQYGTTTDITPTGLNGLANGSSITSSAVNNTTNLMIDALVELTYVFGTAPTANNNITIEVQSSIDGTNFTDIQNPPYVILLTADTTTHRVEFFLSTLFGNSVGIPPYVRFKITNNGGQALALTGNTLKIVPIYAQVV